MSLLQVVSATQSFGKLVALTDINLQLNAGEIIGVIGPNGAGKTTLFNLLCGIYTPQQGKIYLREQNITGLRSDIIARLGLARTFQNIRLFKQLSVLDNVRAVIYQDYSLFSAVLGNKRGKMGEQAIRIKAQELLRLFQLHEYADKLAADLPYGMQRRLEMARALAIHPLVLLLDEPSCGMNQAESIAMQELILQIKNQYELAILLIDHQMPFVMSLCPKLIVLNFGKIIAEGNPEFIRNHPEVIESYLGGAC